MMGTPAAADFFDGGGVGPLMFAASPEGLSDSSSSDWEPFVDFLGDGIVRMNTKSSYG